MIYLRLSIDTGLRYDYSRVDAAKFYLKSRWEERGYAAEFADFIVGAEEGNQWLAKA
jgi:iron complex outermembrane receptor protein